MLSLNLIKFSTIEANVKDLCTSTLTNNEKLDRLHKHSHMKIALTGMNWGETDSPSDGPQTHQLKLVNRSEPFNDPSHKSPFQGK